MAIRFLVSVLQILQFCMFARAICSFFPQMQRSSVCEILYYLTEPIIMPFRALFSRMQNASMIPIDIAYTAAFFTLIIIQQILISM